MSQQDKNEEFSSSGFPIGSIHNTDLVLQTQKLGRFQGNVYDDKELGKVYDDNDLESIADPSIPLSYNTKVEIIVQKLARLNTQNQDLLQKFKLCQDLTLGEKGYWRLLNVTPVDVNDSIDQIMNIDNQICELWLKTRVFKSLFSTNADAIISYLQWIKNIEVNIRVMNDLVGFCLEAIASYDKDPPLAYKMPYLGSSASPTDLDETEPEREVGAVKNRPFFSTNSDKVYLLSKLATISDFYSFIDCKSYICYRQLIKSIMINAKSKAMKGIYRKPFWMKPKNKYMVIAKQRKILLCHERFGLSKIISGSRIKKTKRMKIYRTTKPIKPTSTSASKPEPMMNNGNEDEDGSGSESDSTDSQSPPETSYEYPSGYGTEVSQEYTSRSDDHDDDDESIYADDWSRRDDRENNDGDRDENRVNNNPVDFTEDDTSDDEYTETSPLIEENKPWWKCGCKIL